MFKRFVHSVRVHAAICSKTLFLRNLVKTIRAVHAGRRYVAAVIAEEIAAHVGAETLTGREIAVLKVVAAGNSNRDVARLLAISLETVKQHMKNIAAKLGTRDRAHAVAIAVKRGFIDL